MAELALRRDLRRLRRLLALLAAFLILPWMFRYVGVSYPDRALEQPAPVRLPAPVPVPDAYPVTVRWAPLPLPALAEWVERRYPGALIGLEEIAVIDGVARQWNVSTILLLSIVGAEHSFLAPGAVGLAHALRFYQNPFSYGVYPGSPFPFAIGLEASAAGAASIVSRVVRSLPPGQWGEAEHAEFYRRLSGVYVLGDAGATHGTWLRNVSLISRSLWETAAADPREWAHAMRRATSVEDASLRQFASSAVADAKALGVRAYEGVVDALATVEDWLSENAPVLREAVMTVLIALVVVVAAVAVAAAAVALAPVGL